MTTYLRDDWGARPARSVTLLAPPEVDELFLHYTTGDELGVDDCAAWVRAIQNFHMDKRQWVDIAYSWLVCRHGDAFEGRGWRARGAATYGHNDRSVAVCFMGDDDPDYRDATPEARATIRRLADQADAVFGRKLNRRPHSAVRDTSCPGDELRAWLAAGMPLPEEDDMPLSDDDIQRIREELMQYVLPYAEVPLWLALDRTYRTVQIVRTQQATGDRELTADEVAAAVVEALDDRVASRVLDLLSERLAD